ncbi:MAG: hypothetical protein SGBAC_010388 [Bacillariaceae sp.]
MHNNTGDDMPIPQQVWEDAPSSSRSVSEGSLTASSEQLALFGFAYQLTSIIASDDGSIADEVDVQEEAKLLMSLSCSSPSPTNIYSSNSTNSNSNSNHHPYQTTNATTSTTATNTTQTTSSTTSSTGRITPSSDTSSCYSSSSSSSNTSSKRDSFRFTCPSLSLENHSRAATAETTHLIHPSAQESSVSSSSLPSVLLSRSLKIDDKDALRLSSEAMGRNILQSYKKALDWRLKSWKHSLSRILAQKERDLATNAHSEEDKMQALLTSGEANLLLALKAMEHNNNLRVIDATTSFKVLPQRLNNNNTNHNNNNNTNSSEQQQETSLEETEYEYQVAHAMTLEGILNIHTPAGYCKIELEVPGSMTGTFLSPSDTSATEELTDVCIDVNTDILAAMIEKSSRTVMRAAAEALLKGEGEPEEQQEKSKEEVTTTADAKTVVTSPQGTKMEEEIKKEEQVETPQTTTTTTTPHPTTAATTTSTTTTPKRKFSEERMSRMVVITPARNAASSPSSFGDSDCEDHKPVLLSLPDSFGTSESSKAPSLRMLTPKPSRKKQKKASALLPTVVTPHKTQRPEAITNGAGPTLPMLVELACAMVKK